MGRLDVFMTDSMHLVDLLWLLAFGCILSLVSADCFRRLDRRWLLIVSLVPAALCLVGLAVTLCIYLL